MKVVFILNNWKSRFSGTLVMDINGRRQSFPCAIGRSGISARKKEGDGASPLGRYRMMEVYYRKDRVKRPRTKLPVKPIRQSDGWCDDPQDRNYNGHVTLPYPKSHEILQRSDHLYDLMVVLDYNISQKKRGAGSAIFLHLAREGFTATEGCVAVTEHVMRLLLGAATRETELVISL